MTIIINNADIRIRPSAIDSFFGCSYQWGKTFLEGVNSIPNARAAIGTGIHSGAELCWNESIKKKSKVVNISAMTDAAVESFVEQTKDGMEYDEGENADTSKYTIAEGIKAFAEDIVPYAKIPSATEMFFKVDLDHPIVSELGGTVDYITENTIADLKTSKRKPTTSNYVTQQSVYTYLAQQNGIDVKHNLIQAVVLKKASEGMILPMEPNVDQAKNLINIMLDTLELVSKDVAPIETILRGNPKYMFCSNKYCALYNNCPFVKGKETKTTQVQVKL